MKSSFDINPFLLEAREYPMEALAKLKKERMAQGLPVYDFGTGDPKIPIAPFLNQALIEALPEVPQYPLVRGEQALLEAISRYLKRIAQIEVDPNNILPTGGSKEAIYHLYPLLLHENAKRKGVIYPDPGYPVYSSGAQFQGGQLFPVPIGTETNFQIDLSQVRQDILSRSCLAWICNPHNPTGAVGNRDWLKKQIEVARENDLLLCVDECYFEIYSQEKISTALEFSTGGLLVFHSLSKRSGFTAYRSGFITGDETVMNHLKKMRAHFGVASQSFVQKMAAAAWDDDKHVRERREIFNQRRHIACDFLDRNQFDFCGREATFYLWIKIPDGSLNEENYCRVLFEQAGIIASPGTFFGKAGQGYIRLALVPDLEETQIAFNLWQELIDSKKLF